MPSNVIGRKRGTSFVRRSPDLVHKYKLIVSVRIGMTDSRSSEEIYYNSGSDKRARKLIPIAIKWLEDEYGLYDPKPMRLEKRTTTIIRKS